jgi:high-affinity Fe2+/Pb2+ permease
VFILWIKNRQKNENISPKSLGIEAGLRIALFFAVAFYWLGYSALLSIFLAAIAGLSGGCIICWWQITDEPEHQPPEPKKKKLES